MLKRYNIGRYNVTNQFLNMLPADAQTIGNHEFDHDIEGVLPFLTGQISPVSQIFNSNMPKKILILIIK